MKVIYETLSFLGWPSELTIHNKRLFFALKLSHFAFILFPEQNKCHRHRSEGPYVRFNVSEVMVCGDRVRHFAPGRHATVTKPLQFQPPVDSFATFINYVPQSLSWGNQVAQETSLVVKIAIT